jgi:UDP-2,4-diacetamido-2,4,6-trideoxy-beta-L-altropyranose hydrolase
MRVLFRCDGGFERGSGHVMRCLCLAEKLRGAGVDVVFACTQEDGFPIKPLRDLSIPLLTLNQSRTGPVITEQIWADERQYQDFEDLKNQLGSRSFDWAIVDHYGLSDTWEGLARSVASKIMVIDDLANRRHDCDILLDQNEYCDKDNRYTALVPHDTELFLGGKFALLRDEFAQARKKTGGIRENAENILIMMGGADDRGTTLNIMRAITPVLTESGLHADIVINPRNPSRADILALAKQAKSSVHPGHGHISDLMIKADIAFGAGGTSTWEYCCLGIPMILTPFARNQMHIVRDCVTKGIALSPHPQHDISTNSISSVLNHLIASRILRHNLHDNCLSLIDGGGADRIVQVIPC